MQFFGTLFTLYTYPKVRNASQYISKSFEDADLQATPVKRVSIGREIVCVMRCANEEWCQAINFINSGELNNCELFNERQVGSGEVIKDELSVYYRVQKIDGKTFPRQLHNFVLGLFSWCWNKIKSCISIKK